MIDCNHVLKKEMSYFMFSLIFSFNFIFIQSIGGSAASKRTGAVVNIGIIIVPYIEEIRLRLGQHPRSHQSKR